MAEEQKIQHQKPSALPAAQKESDNFKYIVRIANTDLDGKRQLIMGLQKIKGISFTIANAFCALAKIDRTKRIGELSEQEVSKLDSLIRTKKPTVPHWMLNRRKDIETGEDIHLIGADLTFSQESDIRFLKKIKCYRGVRHMLGQPVRGQRTKSNFRKNKGKVASIKRAVVAKQAAQTKAKEVKAEAKGAKK